MTREVRRAAIETVRTEAPSEPETANLIAADAIDPKLLLREAAQLRKTGYRSIVNGVEMLRDADNIEKGQMTREVFRVQKCKGCGKNYPLSVGEIAWLESMGYEIRKRCRDCVAMKGERRGNRAK